MPLGPPKGSLFSAGGGGSLAAGTQACRATRGRRGSPLGRPCSERPGRPEGGASTGPERHEALGPWRKLPDQPWPCPLQGLPRSALPQGGRGFLCSGGLGRPGSGWSGRLCRGGQVVLRPQLYRCAEVGCTCLAPNQEWFSRLDPAWMVRLAGWVHRVVEAIFSPEPFRGFALGTPTMSLPSPGSSWAALSGPGPLSPAWKASWDMGCRAHWSVWAGVPPSLIFSP